MEDLSDSLLPVRAHGLIALRKLLLAKDPTTLKSYNQILSIFFEQIADEDTYIYLGAINGLSALVDIFPQQILPFLCKEYNNVMLSETTRGKIGESLLQIGNTKKKMYNFMYN